MAFAVVVSRMGGPSLLPAIGVRAAFLHGNSPCNEKWDNKWKSNSYGHMDANSCRKRHRIYVKRQKRAAEKRTLLEWRSLEMHADDYREVQERRKQQGEASSPSPHASKFGWSRRFEKEWQFFQKKHKGMDLESSSSYERPSMFSRIRIAHLQKILGPGISCLCMGDGPSTKVLTRMNYCGYESYAHRTNHFLSITRGQCMSQLLLDYLFAVKSWVRDKDF
jgi:hypothetical protein